MGLILETLRNYSSSSWISVLYLVDLSTDIPLILSIKNINPFIIHDHQMLHKLPLMKKYTAPENYLIYLLLHKP